MATWYPPTMAKALLISIQVGLPREQGEDAEQHNGRWFTGFFKEPVSGTVDVTETGIGGDGQADPRFHGGPDKAVLAYAADHYPTWRDELQRPEMAPGGFGENLTISRITESDVCIGDIWRIAAVRFQVTQPRQPCWKLGRRWNLPELPKRVIATHRCGWYFRVLTPGQLSAGESVELEERPHPAWTIVRANQVMYSKGCPTSEIAALKSLPPLSAAWRDELAERL